MCPQASGGKLPALVPGHDARNPLIGIQQVADGGVVVQGIDDVGDIFAHVAVDVPFPAQQLRCLIDQVRSQHPVDDSFFISPVEFVQAAGEQPEGGEDEYLVRPAVLQLRSHLQHAVPGGDHVIDDDHVLALHAGAQEFVGDDGIASVDYPCVVAPLIEHAHVQAQHIGTVDGPGHAALVGAYDHHVVSVYLQVPHMAQQPLDELIGRLHGLEAVEGDGVLDPGVMGVEGDDVVHAHLHQLLQRQRAVQGLPVGALVLAALVQKGHDHRDAPGLAAHGGDDPLQILIVVIGGHVVLLAAQAIGQGIVADIHQQVEVEAADGFQDHPLGLPGAKTGHP